MGSKRISTKGLRALFAGTVMGIAVATPAAADFDDALCAYATPAAGGGIDQAKVAEAMDLWYKYAVAGDVLSRHVLGDLYSNAPIYTQTVDADTPACRDLDIPSPEETGVISEDPVQALAWYTIAATHNFDDYSQKPDFRQINAKTNAQLRLPELRATMTTEQVEAAQQEVVNILSGQTEFDLFRLGAMYQSGNGLPKNNVEALKFYTLATNRARNSNQSAARAANYLMTLMTSEEIGASKKLANEWEPPLPAAFNQASPHLVELENKNRLLLERQAALSIEKLEREFNAKNEHVVQNALAALGLYLGEIDGSVGPETRNAIKRFQYTLVETDDSLSLEDKRDIQTGTLTVMQKVALIERAARANHPQSQYIYGIMHAEGIGRTVDGKEAVKWLKNSANFGYPLAHFALGTYYRDGIYGDNPVRPSKSEASLHFGQAAALGYEPAQKELVELNYEFNYIHD